MQTSAIFLLLLAALVSLVASNACIVGGPADDVTNAHRFAFPALIFFADSPNQEICVLSGDAQDMYFLLDWK